MSFSNKEFLVFFPTRKEDTKLRSALGNLGVNTTQIKRVNSENQLLDLSIGEIEFDLIFVHEDCKSQKLEELCVKLHNLFPKAALLIVGAESSGKEILENPDFKYQVVTNEMLQPQFLDRLMECAFLQIKYQQAEKDILHLQKQLEEYGAYPYLLNTHFRSESLNYISSEMQAVMAQLRKVAPLNISLIIQGENGTGKTTLARKIHKLSKRSHRPLILMNCATMNRSRIVTDLFGQASEDDAKTERYGKLEMAHTSTLILEGIDELPENAQEMLFEIMRNGRFQKPGGDKWIEVDVRIVATTQKNLRKLVNKGQFHRHLYDRLNAVNIEIPPLRHRPKDIAVLAEQFVRKISKKYKRSLPSLTQGDISRLQAHSWMGNAVELEDAIEQAILTATGDKLDLREISEMMKDGGVHNSEIPDPPSLQQVEHDYIVKVLHQCDWRINGKGGAAEILGVEASHLRHLMNKHNIEQP